MDAENHLFLLRLLLKFGPDCNQTPRWTLKIIIFLPSFITQGWS